MIGLHFVGIGGIGMSGIAEVFLNQGYRISGSDLSESDSTRRLVKMGAKIAVGHRAENVGDEVRVVVISSAVKKENPEVREAQRRQIPVIARAEMLGELMRGKTGVAVAGAHGKTSTTSMLATILTVADFDPTLVIGGKVDSLGGNAKLGQSKWVVAEADESDGSFLHLPATYAIVTNLDNDHLDHFGTVGAIEDAFVAFVAKLPFYGLAVLCGDDPGVQRILGRLTKPFVTYGEGAENAYRISEVHNRGGASSWNLLGPNGFNLKLDLHVPGRHNVMNATAAAVLAHQLKVSPEKIVAGIAQYHGVKRRFELRWKNEKAKVQVIDDYGHHPTEIAATLRAARDTWKGRILAIFQPHRYSRTLHCREGFLSAFRDCDLAWFTEIYAAGEEPIPGVSGQSLVREIQARNPDRVIRFSPTLDAARDAVMKMVQPGDLILCLGAGTITQLPDRLSESLNQRFGNGESHG